MSGPFGAQQWIYDTGADFTSQSLRFNDDDSAYLEWTPDSAGNRKTWTWSGWVKRANVSTTSTQFLFSTHSGGSVAGLWFNGSSDIIRISDESNSIDLRTNAVYRDPSAWYHIVYTVDTTQATASDRAKLYVNGEQVTSFSTATYPSQDSLTFVNNTLPHGIGYFTRDTAGYLDGYLAEVNFIDGQALTADDFGETKNGMWVPKDPSGLTYGTNGFRLTFEDDTEVEAFNTVLYEGNGGTQSVTGMGFQPDLVWIKNRNGTQVHQLFDVVRGVEGSLRSNATDAENIDSPNDRLLSFDSNGFSLGDDGNPNGSGNTYVAWGWKAGDSNVSNTDGSITSTVRANTDYGFSIVSTENHTGSQTVGHGLSSAPDLIIAKARNGALIWPVYHSALGNTERLRLNDTNAAETNAVWGNIDPTTSVFTFNQSSSTYNYIFYCWAEKLGYSKFGSYTGTGSSGKVVDGFGFAPAWVLIKRTDSTDNWRIFDNTRGTVNTVYARLEANNSNAEATSTSIGIDFDSDGFTIQSSDSGVNASGGTYIYAAFADTREAAFWLDQSGNNNDWQPVNLDHNDTVADSPTDNFCTWNPLRPSNDFTFSDGNLRLVESTSGYATALSTIGVSSGKYYIEIDIKNASGNGVRVGIARSNFAANQGLGTGDSYAISNNLGDKYNQGSFSSYATSFTGDSVIGIALDLDAGTIIFTINGTSYGTAFTGLSGEWFFAVSAFPDQSDSITANFGQSGFTYTPPTGYLALSTANLPDPVIDPAQGSSPEDYFNTVLYTGNGSTQDIDVGFATDFVWAKSRSAAVNHRLFDQVRGVRNKLVSNSTAAEEDEGGVTAFNSDGFSLGSDGGINTNGATYVAWNWKANGTGVSNSDGDIPSTVSANTESGFSIGTYTGTGVQDASVGHGLGARPDFLIIKQRNGSNVWMTNHSALPYTTSIDLNDTTIRTGIDYFGDTDMDSVVFHTDSGNSNISSGTFVFYAWKSVEGFSKFGSYEGNGNADGPFVYTGFRPAFVIIKSSTDSNGRWEIKDSKRPLYNPATGRIWAERSDAEATGADTDFVSNGFKITTSDGTINASGGTFIYMAFAEQPFKYTNAR